MNLHRQPLRQKIALALAIIDGLLVVVTLLKHVPVFKTAFGSPLAQLLTESTWWADIAETLFYCAILVTLYGLISLWMPDLRLVLWAGLSLVVIAGLLYLLSALLFYQEEGMGPPIQQGLFMFVISLLFPFMALKVLKRVKRRAASHPGW